MNTFFLKSVNSKYIEQELDRIGFDRCYIAKAGKKFKYVNIKIFSLTPAQANILKQTALIFGADCGVNRDVITGKAELSDAILCGSYSQLNKIAAKLKEQPLGLSTLGEQIIKFIEPKFRKTKLVGILNLTSDSFSDGGLFLDKNSAESHLLKLIQDGADAIDIGAESTKPYSNDVSPKVQIERLKPILEFVQKENIQVPISIDTRSSEVADFALNNGAKIINDVSGFDFDSRMVNVISQYGASVIIQHSKGTPDVMQKNPVYQNVVEEIILSLKNKIELAKENGIGDIIIDPGIGFGKTREDNFVILDRINEFFSLSCPVMVGVSRKSFLGIAENNDLKDSLTLAVSYPLFKYGVDYLRVHNVSLHKYLLKNF